VTKKQANRTSTDTISVHIWHILTLCTWNRLSLILRDTELLSVIGAHDYCLLAIGVM